MAQLKASLAGLPGRRFGDLTIEAADDFSYTDPVDGSISPHQGVRIFFESGSRIVFRLSGTGTEGATLRVYLERYEGPDGQLEGATADMLAGLAAAADAIAGISVYTGRTAPDVVT
jgi:phosphoglucomutase